MACLERALMRRMLGAGLGERLGRERGAAPPAERADRERRRGAQDGEGPGRGAGDRGAARARRQLRAAAGRRGPGPGLRASTRRSSPWARAGHERARHPRPPRGASRARGLSRLISRVTGAVMDEVREWRSRALDAVHPVVIVDALRVRSRDRDGRMVRDKAVCIASGIAGDGQREVLGLRVADTEGATLWLAVRTELKRPRRPGHPDRGRGRPEGLSRGDRRGLPSGDGPGLRRPSRAPLGSTSARAKQRKAVAARLRAVYGAETAETARDAARRPSTGLGAASTPRSPRPGGERGRRARPGGPSGGPRPRRTPRSSSPPRSASARRRLGASEDG